jgi:hypothetical protein
MHAAPHGSLARLRASPCLTLLAFAAACRAPARQEPEAGPPAAEQSEQAAAADAEPEPEFDPVESGTEEDFLRVAQGEDLAQDVGDGPKAAPAGESAAEQAEQAEQASDSKLHGSLTSSWRGRWGGDQHDNDLRELLALDYGDAERDAWTARFTGLLAGDLDGDGEGLFFELQDTLDGALDTQVYDAYVEGHDLGPLETVRLGRQSLWDTPVFVWFDGVTAQTEARGSDAWQLGAWGGRPVHAYESSSGDVVGGLYAQASPWEAGRVRMDWMHLVDEESSGESSNDLLSLALWQGLGERLQVHGGYTHLDGESRDVTLRGTWTDAEQDLQIQASYYGLLEGQADLALELDPYFETLGALFPYDQARLMAAKRLNERIGLQAGVDLRRVHDSGDVGMFNRDFERFFGTVTLEDVLPAELVLALTGEVWDGNGSSIDTWGADLSRAFGEDFTGSVGSAFALYKSDLFATTESENVRTWYTRLRWRSSESTRWDLRYDAEDTDLDWFHMLRVAMTWHF